MAYGIIKIDTITFTDGGIDKSVAISGLVQNPTFTGNVTVTGTISGNTVQGQTISGVTVTGTTANFVSGVFTTQISGATVTGTTANFTSGNFTNISGGTHTITSGVFAAGTAANPSISFTSDPNTGIYSPGADQVAISTNGTGRLFVDASGNVGVGISPAKTIDVYVTGTVQATLRLSDVDSRNVELRSPSPLGALAGVGTVTNHDFTFFINNTERARLDTSGRLGLGTSTPGTPLHVSAAQGIVKIESSTGTNSTLAQFTNTAGNAFVGLEGSAGGTFGTGAAPYSLCMTHQGAYPLHLITSNVVRATIDSSGRVGIGTTSPANGSLNVVADSSANGINLNCRSDNDFGYIRFSNNSGSEVLGYIGIARTGTSAGSLLFENSGSERARIDSSGRLLVGTSSARGYGDGNIPFVQVERATIGGDIANIGVCNNGDNGAGPKFTLAKSRGGSVGGVTVVQNGDSLGSIQWSGADGTDIESVAASITAQVDGTPGANDMPGRLVFSTCPDGSASPVERLRITNGGASAFYCDSTVDTLYSSSAAAAGTSRYLFIGTHSATGPLTGTNAILIFTNGNVQNTNNSYGAISDIKLKENIVDANSQWGDLKALQVRNYNFKEGQTHTQIGLIAQEVELVSPGLVTESPDRDEEGNDLGTVTKSVNYSVLYMKAVKALQEAMERIEVLEQRLTDAGIA